ncbi:GspMb/PilO family protein [Vibrio rotiferianus]|uniref:GspMb/PilO family protein n=1 Tax=Vibrio rotiferianus TaxID=190895 RepID=UPI000B59CD22|nr:GspMb/PilO family protein [Vibrio rotiferianus]ASI97588.1 hypothetical protein BSZ04_22190 [Vibrio rotiferianus]
MNLLNDRRALLGIVGILMLLRFGLVPLLEWQNEKWQQISSLNQRLEKSEALIERTEFIAKLETKLEAQVEKQQAQFVSGRTDDAIQLQQQKKIESLIKQHDLKMANTRWLGSVPQGNYTEYRLEVGLNGKISDFIGFLQSLEQQATPIRLQGWIINMRGMSEGSIGAFTTARATIRVMAKNPNVVNEK